MDIEILENELLWLENIGCVILYEKDGILVESAYDVSTDFNFFILFNANVQMRKGCYRVEYSCAVKPPIRQTGNRLSGPAGTAYASLLT